MTPCGDKQPTWAQDFDSEADMETFLARMKQSLDELQPDSEVLLEGQKFWDGKILK